jgi:hypothetical protein
MGQPGVVSETVTSTTPLALRSIARTMSSSTIERRSSGSITTSSALRMSSLSVTSSIVANPLAPAKEVAASARHGEGRCRPRSG